MKKILATFAVLLFFGMHNHVFAWGKTGHRIIAEIAERHLTSKTKRNIQKISGKQSLAYWADWSDFIKSDPELNRTTSSWHYLNFPEKLNREQFDSVLYASSDEFLYKRTKLIINQLKNRKDDPKEVQQQNLYFLIHLMGDLHQPLHVGREEDLGGNKLEIKWFNNTTNIHSFWDTKFVEFQEYSYSEYAHILDFHSKKDNAMMASGELEDWFYDSYKKVEFIYDNVKKGDNLRYEYDYKHKAILEEQLLKGGLRLAKVLNKIFG